MKRIKYLLLLLSLAFGAQALAKSGDVQLGLSLIGSHKGNSDTYDVEGVLLFNYDGYGIELGMDKDLRLVPTDARIAIDGKEVQVYTNVATLDYYVADDLELAISAISIDYRKFNDYSIRKSEKAAAVSVAATKYVEVGSIVMDLSVSTSVGGYTRDQILLDDGASETVKDTHYYTIGAKIGVDVPITDEFRLYFYARADFQKGDETEKMSYSAGVELYEGLSLFNDTITVIPYIDYVSERLDRGSSSTQDDMIRFGFKIKF